MGQVKVFEDKSDYGSRSYGRKGSVCLGWGRNSPSKDGCRVVEEEVLRKRPIRLGRTGVKVRQPLRLTPLG